jgi:hypothetical protein
MAEPTPRARLKPALLLAAAAAAAGAAAALASETLSYEYDARGRLTKVVRTDSATGKAVTTTYGHDKADNRTKRETE